MKTVAFTLRAAATAAVALAAASSAQAQLKIPFAWTESNSVQTFTDNNLAAFDLVNLVVRAKGNATEVGARVVGETNGTETAKAFKFPITEIVIGSKLNIAAGSASGSALYFEREDILDTGEIFGFTLANFTINYDTKQVLADVTPNGGATAAKQPIYTFNVNTKLALKYKFPLTVTGHEVLDQLKLTEGIKAVFTSVLNLPEFALPQLEEEYGNLTQDVSTNLRKVKISSAPYVPQ